MVSEMMLEPPVGCSTVDLRERRGRKGGKWLHSSAYHEVRPATLTRRKVQEASVSSERVHLPSLARVCHFPRLPACWCGQVFWKGRNAPHGTAWPACQLRSEDERKLPVFRVLYVCF